MNRNLIVENYINEINKTKKYIDSLYKSSNAYKQLINFSNEIIKKYDFTSLIPKIDTPVFKIEYLHEIQKTLEKYKEIAIKYDFSKIINHIHIGTCQTPQIKLPNNLKKINEFIDKFYESVNFSNIVINNNGIIIYDNEIIQKDEIEDEFLNTIENNELFLYKDFSKLSLSKKIIIGIILQVIIGILSNLFSNLFYDYIKDNKKQYITVINNKIKANIYNINSFPKKEFVRDVRVVSISILNIRKAPTKSSRIIGKLHLGDIVKIIYKKRNWSYIQCDDEKNDIIEGWVFTRYLKKIK